MNEALKNRLCGIGSKSILSPENFQRLLTILTIMLPVQLINANTLTETFVGTIYFTLVFINKKYVEKVAIFLFRTNLLELSTCDVRCSHTEVHIPNFCQILQILAVEMIFLEKEASYFIVVFLIELWS